MSSMTGPLPPLPLQKADGSPASESQVASQAAQSTSSAQLRPPFSARPSAYFARAAPGYSAVRPLRQGGAEQSTDERGAESAANPLLSRTYPATLDAAQGSAYTQLSLAHSMAPRPFQRPVASLTGASPPVAPQRTSSCFLASSSDRFSIPGAHASVWCTVSRRQSQGS